METFEISSQYYMWTCEHDTNQWIDAIQNMESFTLFRKHLAMNGIILQRLPKNSNPFNLNNSAVIVLASLLGFSLTKLLDDASTFEDYTNIIYRMFIVIIFTIFYTNFVWKAPILFGLVSRLEAIINKSKWRIYFRSSLAYSVEI